MCATVIASLPHTHPAVAARIHSIQQAAYAAEATLLGVERFPPLERTVDDVQASAEQFLGAFDGDELTGTLGIEVQADNVIEISSLTVAPSRHRQGIGRSLVNAVLGRRDWQSVSVSTGAKNAPALALYRRLGFVEHARRTIDPGAIEIVVLRIARSNPCESTQP